MGTTGAVSYSGVCSWSILIYIPHTHTQTHAHTLMHTHSCTHTHAISLVWLLPFGSHCRVLLIIKSEALDERRENRGGRREKGGRREGGGRRAEGD